LRANGATDPTKLTWKITAGADKVEFDGAAAGAEVQVKSKAGSRRQDDVSVDVQDGSAAGTPAYSGKLTVRKPDNLISRMVVDHGSCPAWAGCAAACPAYWTEIDYRIVDNVGGTIVGATVNEKFPSAKVNDQATDWGSPAAFATTPSWPNTNGTFIDNWFQSCGTPSPVAPGAANAGQKVDHMEHEFYVGSTSPGKGCRVQKHTAQRYLGFARHENITTPAP
jgi:hypothetical protein